MTTEEKAKAYDEALEKARMYRDNAKAVEEYAAVARYENIFPQLRESEDERIRKALILHLQAFYSNEVVAPGISKEMAIAWLEKQKEQIPYIDFVIKPHKGDDNNPYDMQVSEAQEYAIKRGFGIPFNDGEVYVDERHLTQTIGNILRWADEHPKEQKPAWSEEDESCWNLIWDILDGSFTASKEGYKKAAAWFLKNCPKGTKSLRPSWKPSEEQMEAFRKYIEDFQARAEAAVGGWNNFDVMIRLYEQLKKQGVKEEPEYYQHFDPDC